jgi:hypothetical protein
MPKAFRDFAHFLKVYFALKKQVDPEKVAATLGRPETLELSEGQAEYVELLFCGPHDMPGTRERPAGFIEIKDHEYPHEPPEIARAFFKQWPRTDFRYFMALSADGLALEFTNADPALDGVELIQAAMVKLGAIKKHEDDGEWYYQTAHPMTKRMAEYALSQAEPKSKQHGIFA